MNALKFIGGALAVFIIITIAVFILYTVVGALISFLLWDNLFSSTVFLSLLRCAMVSSFVISAVMILSDVDDFMDNFNHED